MIKRKGTAARSDAPKKMSVREKNSPTITSDSETLNSSILLAVSVNPLTDAVYLVIYKVVKCREVNIIVEVGLVVTDILDNCLLLACIDSEGINRRRLDVRNRKEHD